MKMMPFFAPLSDEIPNIDLPAEISICRLEKNKDGIVTGAQLVHDDEENLSQAFMQPMGQVQHMDMKSIMLKMLRIAGFPVNGMKMQLLVAGISTAACTHGCLNCCPLKDEFKLMPPCLHAKLIE